MLLSVDIGVQGKSVSRLLLLGSDGKCMVGVWLECGGCEGFLYFFNK